MINLLANSRVMGIQADINWIREELGSVTEPHLIEAFKNMLKYRKSHIEKDWWGDIDKTEKAEIEEGVRQLDSGEFISHEEVLKDARKWA